MCERSAFPPLSIHLHVAFIIRQAIIVKIFAPHPLALSDISQLFFPFSLCCYCRGINRWKQHAFDWLFRHYRAQSGALTRRRKQPPRCYDIFVIEKQFFSACRGAADVMKNAFFAVSPPTRSHLVVGSRFFNIFRRRREMPRSAEKHKSWQGTPSSSIGGLFAQSSRSELAVCVFDA
jgi:hypothetical protein